MTKERFEQDYNVKISQLNWQLGWNGRFECAEAGPYTVYRDEAWGYYVVEGNARIHWRRDLSKYI